jgi:hypothetical protein
MKGLEKHPQCQTDLITEKVVHNHGRNMLAAMDALLKKNDKEADLQFNEALKLVSRFAEALYCLDYAGLYYWDTVISSLWLETAKKPLSDLTFEQAVIALWNPALLVVDFIQITGQSQIINVIAEMEPNFRLALAKYPVDTYGAAWLDKIGTSHLMRLEGDMAMHNLVSALAEPLILGLGHCTLASHATKLHPAEPCLSGLQLTNMCNGSHDMLSMLIETGLIYNMLQANHNGPQAPTANVSAPLAYFDRSVNDLHTNLCILIKNLKPTGLSGLIQQKIGSFRMPPGAGCAFAIATEGLTGAGGEMAGRIVQCLEKNQLKAGLFDPVEVRFPIPISCESTKGEWFYGHTNKVKDDILLESPILPNFSKNDFNPASWDSWFGGVEGYTADGARFRFENSGKLVAITETTEHKDGSKTEVTDTVWGTTIIKHTDKNGIETEMTVSSASTTYTRDKNGNWVKEEEGEDPPPYRPESGDRGGSTPIGPDQPGGCGGTPAMQRAHAIFNCIFSNTDFEETGTIAPWIHTEGPSGLSNPMCNKIDVAAIWKSSTGPSVTDPTDPEDFVRAGPNIFLSFIPKLHGAIDPIEMDRLRAKSLFSISNIPGTP